MVLAKGEVGQAMVGVEAAEEAEVPLLLFLVVVVGLVIVVGEEIGTPIVD